MPWKERTKMSERMRFISRLEDGEKMSDLCREYGISRKTGYKFLERFKREGVRGLGDYRRRPYSCPHRTRPPIVKLIVDLKKEKPHWGSPKIRELFIRRYPHFKVPARSTVHSILEKAGFVKHHSRRSRPIYAKPTHLTDSINPNDLWCIDFKGEFAMKDRTYCYPLTVSDHASRYLLGLEALESTKLDPVMSIFEEIFSNFGLPQRIRSDNGAPFASTGLYGLTRLSVWFLRLGIELERIAPGHPEQNGRHERIHRTLKEQMAQEQNLLLQQQYFDQFLTEYNSERPHEALEMKTPSEIYSPSSRIMPQLIDLNYPAHDHCKRVTRCGHVVLGGPRKNVIKFYLGVAFGGERIGLLQVEDNLWRVDFMDKELGYFDETDRKFLPTELSVD